MTVKSSWQLTYTTRELSPRDAILFKTLVRLVRYALSHDWDYVPGDADLVVRGEMPLPAGELQELPLGTIHHTLLVGVAPHGRQDYLCLPMRPQDVQDALDRIGALRERQLVASALRAPSRVGWRRPRPLRLSRQPSRLQHR